MVPPPSPVSPLGGSRGQAGREVWGARRALPSWAEPSGSPGCERAGDQTLVIGWAGLDHLARARAIAGWYAERKTGEGWDAERLKPMLVALDELIPWLKQWHNAFDPEYGACLGDFYEGFLLEELRTLDLSRDELGDWRPAGGSEGAAEEVANPPRPSFAKGGSGGVGQPVRSRS
jgi:hypothetical protein